MGRGPMINWRRWWPRKAAARPAAYAVPPIASGHSPEGERPAPPEPPQAGMLWNGIFHAGHDAGFVYYDD